MKPLRKSRKNSGQAIVEMVLYLVIVVGAFGIISSAFKQQGLIAQMVSGPWKMMSGMIQNGSWGSSEDTKGFHPNVDKHHRTKVRF